MTTPPKVSSSSRRRVLQALAFATTGGSAAGVSAAAQQPPQNTAAANEPSLEALRQVSVFHGSGLTDERLRVLKPVLERRLAQQLRTVRGFAVDDSLEPTTHGIR